jgi:hypothetical protein
LLCFSKEEIRNKWFQANKFLHENYFQNIPVDKDILESEILIVVDKDILESEILIVVDKDILENEILIVFDKDILENEILIVVDKDILESEIENYFQNIPTILLSRLYRTSMLIPLFVNDYQYFIL